MTDILTIGRKIALYRKKAGFTQQQIAEKLGVSRSLVGQIEKDLTKPNLEFLTSFVKLVNISYSAILDSNQLIEQMNELTDYEPEIRNPMDSPNSVIGSSIQSFFSNFQTALRNLYRIYFIAFEPVYKTIPSTTDPAELRKKLIEGFKTNAIVQEHMREGLLEDHMIDYLADLFLESKEK